MVRLSLLIPAYNEEKRIRETLEDYYNFLLKELKRDFEILVVLNGCRDNTLGVVKEFSRRRKQVKYVDIKEAIGKGGAIIEGFKIVEGDLIGFVDADGATKADVYYDLVLKIGNYEGIIASRWINGAIVNTKQSFMKTLGGRVFNLLVKLFFGIGIRDTQCGAKLFKKEAIKSVVNGLHLTKWAFDVNLLYLMKRYGFKIKEIPTVWVEPGGSGFNLVKTVPEMFLSVIRLRLMYSPFRFVIKAYNKLPEFVKIHHRL